MSSMENSQDDAVRQPNNDANNYQNHTHHLSSNKNSNNNNSNDKKKNIEKSTASGKNTIKSEESSCEKNYKEDGQDDETSNANETVNSGLQAIDKPTDRQTRSISSISQKLYAPFSTPVRSYQNDTLNFNDGSLHAEVDATTRHIGQSKSEEHNRIDASSLIADSSTRQFDTVYNLSSPQAAVTHPNFDNKKTAIDPAQPLSKTPSLDTQYERYLQQLLNPKYVTDKIGEQALPDVAHTSSDFAIDQMLNRLNVVQPNLNNASKWTLIASPELATHLELLYLGGLVDLPDSFFKPVEVDIIQSTMPTKPNATNLSNATNITNALLQPLTQLRLLDLSDIYSVTQQYPNLSRYGLDSDENSSDIKKVKSECTDNIQTNNSQSSRHRAELINDAYAPTWHVILQPEHFDNAMDSLATDILACSVAVHILKQCPVRKTVNRNLTTAQICQHMRSYILSQCNIAPQFETRYRQIRLFEGHVIMAAIHLGLQVSHKQANDNESDTVHLNVSSRGALFNRYPNISQYYVNGWQ